jgi:hypothetical protein
MPIWPWKAVIRPSGAVPSASGACSMRANAFPSPLRGGVGVGVHHIKSRQDFTHDAFEIPENIIVPEPNDFETLSAKIAVAIFVPLLMRVQIVLAAVDLNNKANRAAGKIYNQMVDRYLTAKMKSASFQQTQI